MIKEVPSQAKLPTPYGDFEIRVFHDEALKFRSRRIDPWFG